MLCVWDTTESHTKFSCEVLDLLGAFVWFTDVIITIYANRLCLFVIIMVYASRFRLCSLPGVNISTIQLFPVTYGWLCAHACHFGVPETGFLFFLCSSNMIITVYMHLHNQKYLFVNANCVTTIIIYGWKTTKWLGLNDLLWCFFSSLRPTGILFSARYLGEKLVQNEPLFPTICPGYASLVVIDLYQVKAHTLCNFNIM